MLTPGELEQMRADQAALMFDSVEVDRESSEWSEEQQQTITVWAQVYAGPARVALPHGSPIVTPSGELVTPSIALVTIPFGPVPAAGDRVRIVVARPGLPEYVWVQALEVPGILATACRMACGAK